MRECVCVCVCMRACVCVCVRACVCACFCVCVHAFVCVFMHTIFIFPSVYVPWIPDKDHTQWDHPSVKTTFYVKFIFYISKETNKKSKAKLTNIQRKRRDKIKINKNWEKTVWNRTRTHKKKCNVTLIFPILFCSIEKPSFWTFCLFWILHFQVKNVLQIGTVSVVNMGFCWFWKVVLKEEYSRCTDTDAMAKH